MIPILLLGLVLLISLLMLFISISMIISVIAGAPLVSSPTAIFPDVLRLAELQPGQTLVELGSGVGDLLREASKAGATVKGIDLSPLAYVLSRWNLRHSNNVSIILGSMFDQSLTDADVVFCYLLPPLMKRLEAKFSAELRPGTKVVSYAFQLPTKQPTTIIPRRGSYGRIFLYTY